MHLALKTHLEKEKVHQMRHPRHVITHKELLVTGGLDSRLHEMQGYSWVFSLWEGRGEYMCCLESTSTFTATSSVDKPLGLFTHSV